MENLLLSDTPLVQIGPTLKHNEKLSEIIAREIESFLKDSIVVEAQLNNNDVQSVNNENDIQQLIQLSKQMQHEFKRTLEKGDVDFAPSKEAHQLRKEVINGGQPSESALDRFCIPPLILDDEIHNMDDYCYDLVEKQFTRANENIEKDIQKKNTASVLNVKELSSRHDSPLGKTGCESTRSQPSLISKKTKSKRMYPKVHSCVDLRSSKARSQPSGLSQSARAAYSSRYYDFDDTHPNLKLTNNTDTLFPCRNVKSKLQVPNASLESVIVSESYDAFDFEDIVCQESNTRIDEVPTEDQSVDNARIIVEQENVKYEDNSDKPAISNIDTWHNVLSSNSHLVPVIINETSTYAPESSPLINHESESEKENEFK